MPVFETEVVVDCSLERAFDFLLRPANIAQIAPPDLGLVFTDAPEVLALGTRFEFKVQTFGQIQTMIHEITTFETGRQITETQVKGILGSWVHDHIFEQNAKGQVVIIDRIDFNPPPGMLGLLVTGNKILDQLDDGYYYRHQQLKKLLSAGS